MKKPISILLVCVLLLGMTAFATETDVAPVETVEEAAPADVVLETYDTDSETVYDTEAFYFEDFSTSTVEEIHSATHKYGNVSSEPDLVADKELGYRYAAKSTSRGQISLTNTIITKNSNGDNAIDFNGADGDYGIFYVIPDRTWNMTDEGNMDETYIISMDYEGNPTAGRADYSYLNAYLTNVAGEKTYVAAFTASSNASNLSQFTLTAHPRTHSTGTRPKTLLSGVAYNVGFGYKFNPENPTLPTRSFYFDGATWGADSTTYNDYKIDGKTNIDGFKLSHAKAFGGSYTNIKMYTIKHGAVPTIESLVTEEVNPGETVKFKFSHPVARATLTNENVTIMENGTPFTDFEIASVKTIVDETTKEIYSVIEIGFPYGIRAGVTFDVTFTTGVKNEVGTGLAADIPFQFTTAAPPANVVTLSAKDGLSGTDEITTLTVGEQAKFTATADTIDGTSYMLIGIYDAYDVLVSYTFAKVTQGDVLSLAGKITDEGMTVKAFSAGNLVDLQQFSTPTPITE